jgi:hypothetical protein
MYGAPCEKQGPLRRPGRDPTPYGAQPPQEFPHTSYNSKLLLPDGILP